MRHCIFAAVLLSAAPASAQETDRFRRPQVVIDPIPSGWINASELLPLARSAALARVERGQFVEAAALLTTLVDSGDAWAAPRLARLYMHGLGVSRDDALALSLLEFAAERGDAGAALAAGVARARGLGSAADAQTARHWFVVASRTGNEFVRRDAQRLLRDLPAS